MHRIHNRIIGVVSLRALAEVCITLRYLAHVDTPPMWQSFRVYGAGQAKLAFLKIQQTLGDLPAFVDEAAIHAIANEDVWQEFLNIDVGHWANSNLRKLATECGAKDIYDRYYDWSSGFMHGNWAAVRDTRRAALQSARTSTLPRLRPILLRHNFQTSSHCTGCTEFRGWRIGLCRPLNPTAPSW